MIKNYRHVKLKLRVFLRGYSVAMVTFFVGENDYNLLSNNGNLFDTIVKGTNETVWYQRISGTLRDVPKATQ